MYEDSKIGIIYPPVKEAKYDGKELYFGNKMVLSISQKFYRKSQIKLFKELFKNFTAGIINLKINVVENDMPYVLIGEQAYEKAKDVKLGTNDYAIIIDDKKIQLTGKEWVSMNLFGFTPKAFERFNLYWENFISANVATEKAEALLPVAASDIIKNNEGIVKFFTSSENWFGMTYPEDREIVKAEIANKIKDGYYPEILWEK